MKEYFDKKVVWITGASSGIGEALAEALAGLGSRLILSARRVEELERVKASLSSAPENSLVLPLNLEQPETFPALMTQAMERFGRIDVVIHSGGISQRAMVQDAPLAIDRKVMAVNFFGAVGLTKAVLPVFLSQHSGHFVVISSVVGKFGTPMRSAYAASKHALHGFFESLRAEVWRDQIQVTLVCPGYVRTNISYNAINAAGQKHGRMDRNQLKGMAPEECARRILQAVAAGKQEVVIGGGKETLGVLLKRFFPALFSRIVRRMVPK
jgi:dehydrogenase/reductase SDR family member 7B